MVNRESVVCHRRSPTDPQVETKKGPLRLATRLGAPLKTHKKETPNTRDAWCRLRSPRQEHGVLPDLREPLLIAILVFSALPMSNIVLSSSRASTSGLFLIQAPAGDFFVVDLPATTISGVDLGPHFCICPRRSQRLGFLYKFRGTLILVTRSLIGKLFILGVVHVSSLSHGVEVLSLWGLS